MASLIEIKYNPFVPKLKILIDKEQPSDFSQLVQFTDDNILMWCEKICETIYNEVLDDYMIVFIGTSFDANIFRAFAESYVHCLGFEHVEFDIKTPMNVRLVALNKYILRNKITDYIKTDVHYSLYTDSNCDCFRDEIIAKMNIQNCFCNVSLSESSKDGSYGFVVVSSVQAADNIICNVTNAIFIFVIIIGENMGYTQKKENAIYFSVSKEYLYNRIFDCLLSIPLRTALINTYKSMIDMNRNSPEFMHILAIDPIVQIETEKEIEIGCSSPITIKSIPNNGKVPQLIFKVANSQIATCNGLYITGLNVGETDIEVYNYGEKIPFETISINVIRRNRIASLFLTHDNLMMGEGDEGVISVEFYPEDADNVDEIKWSSSDPSVVSVTNGKIVANNTGKCRIICTAENISTQCLCEVKSYLQDIIISPTFESNIIQMITMDELDLHIMPVPSVCINGKIFIDSSNYDIVNVVGSKLYAKNPGQAVVCVYNEDKSVCKRLSIIVKSPQKKYGKLMQKIIGYMGLEE